MDVRAGAKVEAIGRDDGSDFRVDDGRRPRRGRRRRGRPRDRPRAPSSPSTPVSTSTTASSSTSAGAPEDATDVFAAGDVARFPVAALGGTRRVEHEDHANTHGRVVGANMAGADEPYDHLPFFYSDLFDLGYEAVGDVDSRLDTIAEWAEPNRKGVVCYVDGDGRARGFLLWDVWGKVDAARELIRAGVPVVGRSGFASSSTERAPRRPAPTRATSDSARTSNTTYPLATPLGGFPCERPSPGTAGSHVHVPSAVP